MLEDLKARRSAMTVREIAETLHLSEREIYKLAATNQIPHFKIGSSVRFDAAAVSEWLEQKAAMAFVRRPPASVRPQRERFVKIA
jgi:excisionase family DNA binding protein